MDPDKKVTDVTIDTSELEMIQGKLVEELFKIIGGEKMYAISTQIILPKSLCREPPLMTYGDSGGKMSQDNWLAFCYAVSESGRKIAEWYEGKREGRCPFYYPGAVVEIHYGFGVSAGIILAITPGLSAARMGKIDEEQAAKQLLKTARSVNRDLGIRVLTSLVEERSECLCSAANHYGYERVRLGRIQKQLKPKMAVSAEHFTNLVGLDVCDGDVMSFCAVRTHPYSNVYEICNSNFFSCRVGARPLRRWTSLLARFAEYIFGVCDFDSDAPDVLTEDGRDEWVEVERMPTVVMNFSVRDSGHHYTDILLGVVSNQVDASVIDLDEVKTQMGERISNLLRPVATANIKPGSLDGESPERYGDLHVTCNMWSINEMVVYERK